MKGGSWYSNNNNNIQVIYRNLSALEDIQLTIGFRCVESLN